MSLMNVFTSSRQLRLTLAALAGGVLAVLVLLEAHHYERAVSAMGFRPMNPSDTVTLATTTQHRFSPPSSQGDGGGGPFESPTCEICSSSPANCRRYGTRNLRLSRLYEGSGDRVRRVLTKALDGHGLKIGIIGGSITAGHPWAFPNSTKLWHGIVFEWAKATFPQSVVEKAYGAIPGHGSDFFSYCHLSILDPDVDLVVVELAVNDYWPGQAAVDDGERLVRGLLQRHSHPAVIYAHFMKLDTDKMTGGDSQLGLMNYYASDVPTVGIRPVFLPPIIKDPSLRPAFFASEGWDPSHPGENGHRAMGDFLTSYLDQQLCHIARPELHVPPEEDLGIPVPGPEPVLEIPRLNLVGPFNETHIESPAEPTCLSLHGQWSPPFVPVANQGFEIFIAPGEEKKYWRGQKPGDRVSFELQTSKGQIHVYYLKSHKYDLGDVKCWIDDFNHPTQLTHIQGYWPHKIGIGRSQLIPSPQPLAPGSHWVTCEIKEESAHPNSTTAHSFLLIGIFSI